MARPRKVSSMLAAARRERRRLADWMTVHHDELLGQLGPGRIDWRPVMEVIAKLDLRDEHGQLVTRDTAARTWARVRHRVGERRARETARAGPPLRPGQVAPGVRLVAPASPPGAAHLLKLDLVPALPREAVPANFGSLSAEAGADAAERLKAVINALGVARVAMPRRTS